MVTDRDHDRGQAFTLEAITAAVVLLAAAVFVLQATSVTPQAAATSNQQSVTQLGYVANGVLDSAAADGTLWSTVLYWNASERGFHDADGPDGYYESAPPTAFGQLLNETFAASDVPYNVNVRYLAADGDRRTQRVVHSGAPSDDAVRVATTVTLYDDDRLLDREGRLTDVALSNTGTFYAPDIAPSDGLYNVVEVEVVLWTS